MRTCSKCGKTKPLTDFYAHKDKPLGRRAECAECSKVANKKWQRNNVERSRSYAREYARRNRDRRQHTVRNTKMKNLYGISAEIYDRMLSEQNGACAICHRPPVRKRLNVDHNHLTGKVRGLLCQRCNNRLVATIEHELFDAAMAYVKKWEE